MRSSFFLIACAVCLGVSGCANQTSNRCHDIDVVWNTLWNASLKDAGSASTQSDAVHLLFASAKGGVLGRARLVHQSNPQTPNQRPQLEFFDFGTLTLEGSCVSAVASVAIDRCEVNQAFRIAIGEVTENSGSCSVADSEQESRYLAALQKAQRYEVQGDTLLIYAQGLDQPLRFVRTALPK